MIRCCHSIRLANTCLQGLIILAGRAPCPACLSKHMKLPAEQSCTLQHLLRLRNRVSKSRATHKTGTRFNSFQAPITAAALAEYEITS